MDATGRNACSNVETNGLTKKSNRDQMLFGQQHAYQITAANGL